MLRTINWQTDPVADDISVSSLPDAPYTKMMRIPRARHILQPASPPRLPCKPVHMLLQARHDSIMWEETDAYMLSLDATSKHPVNIDLHENDV